VPALRRGAAGSRTPAVRRDRGQRRRQDHHHRAAVPAAAGLRGLRRRPHLARQNTWLQLAYAIALNGRATVLLSSWLPAQLEPLPARTLIGPIHFCTLDCPDDVLAARLGSRPAWRGTSSSEKIAEHQRFAAWLRAHIRPSFDTSTLSVDETASHVAAWARALLSCEAGDSDGFTG
jgi:hypothetical protein